MEPTCMTATTLIVSSPVLEEKIAGALSLTVVVSLLLGIFVYLRRTWAARMTREEHPSVLARERAVRLAKHQAKHPGAAPGNLAPSCGETIRDYYAFFVDGGIHWWDKDPVNMKGYCRGNRLLFMDFHEKNYWFLVVEAGVAVLCAILDGVKLGPGKCNPVVIVICVVLFCFLVTVLTLRPYTAPFLSLFSILTAGIQFAAALFMAFALFDLGNNFQSRAETLAFVGMYLIVARALFDVVPKLIRLALLLHRSLFGKKKRYDDSDDDSDDSEHEGKRPHGRNVNVDLTQRLLQTVQATNVESQIRLNDHATAASLEMRDTERKATERLLRENDEEEADEFDFLDELLDDNDNGDGKKKRKDRTDAPLRQDEYYWDPSQFANLTLPERSEEDNDMFFPLRSSRLNGAGTSSLLAGIPLRTTEEEEEEEADAKREEKRKRKRRPNRSGTVLNRLDKEGEPKNPQQERPATSVPLEHILEGISIASGEDQLHRLTPPNEKSETFQATEEAQPPLLLGSEEGEGGAAALATNNREVEESTTNRTVVDDLDAVLELLDADQKRKKKRQKKEK
jgi:hypothetical protein